MELPDLHLKEYEKLQHEISDTMNEIGNLEKYAIAATGAIFPWVLIQLAGDLPPNLYYIACFLPLLITGLMGYRAYGLFERVKLMGEYIKTTYESLMGLDSNPELRFGWERFLDTKIPTVGSTMANSRVIMWRILLIVDSIIPVLILAFA